MNETTATGRRALSGSEEPHRSNSRPRRSNTSYGDETLPSDETLINGLIFSDESTTNDAQIHYVDQTTQRPFLSDFLNLDGMLALDDIVPGQVRRIKHTAKRRGK